MPPYRVAAPIAALFLAGCLNAATSPSVSTEAAPTSVSPTAGSESSFPESPASGPAEPAASDTGGSSDCELPVVEAATTPRANITDVRVGTHTDHDRVVFEFADGLPEITLDRATPPFIHDASGLSIDVNGSSFLRLTMRRGTKQMADGSSSYGGPTEFEPGFPTLTHLVEGGDFEAQSTWYIGLSDDACVRVARLTDDGAPRLVIDVEH